MVYSMFKGLKCAMPPKHQNCCHDSGTTCDIFFLCVLNIPGAKFEEHCSDISRDILDSVFYCFRRTITLNSSFASYKNVSISKTKKDILKGKGHSSLF